MASKHLENRKQRDNRSFVIRHSCFVILLASVLSSPLLYGEEPAAVDRQKVESLSPTEKAEILRKKDIFDRLSPAKKDKLRQLDADIKKAEDSEELRRVMREYFDWWKAQPLNVRAELSSTVSPAERVKKIEDLRREERKREAMNRNSLKLTKQDGEVLWDWMMENVKKFEENYRKSLLKEKAKEKIKEWDSKSPQERRGFIMHSLDRSIPSAKEMAELRSKLSPEVKAKLEPMSVGDQCKALRDGMQSAMRRQMAGRWGRPGMFVDEKELEDFFDSDKIDPIERERLLDLPPEQLHNQLQGLYIRWKMSNEPFFFHPEGGPPGGPPGRQRGGPERPRPDQPERPPERSPEQPPEG
jgi:hypothetical protein